MEEARIRQAELFAWSDGRIVLFVDRTELAPIVVRGWLQNDRFSDVRRWHFDSDKRAIGQVRRLIAEATGDPIGAELVAGQLTQWLTSGSHPS